MSLKDIRHTIELIFEPVIEELLNREPFIYGDHPNLWIDFGWHAQHGGGAPGEIIDDYVEQLILGYLLKLPEFVQERIWWETHPGEEYDLQVIQALVTNNDASYCYPPRLEDIQFDVCRFLRHQFFRKAENAYADYESEND